MVDPRDVVSNKAAVFSLARPLKYSGPLLHHNYWLNFDVDHLMRSQTTPILSVCLDPCIDVYWLPLL